MKRLSLDKLIPGMITAEDVYDYSSQLILHKGQVLTQKSISKLQFYAIAFIRVEDEMADTSVAAEPAAEVPADTDVSMPDMWEDEIDAEGSTEDTEDTEEKEYTKIFGVDLFSQTSNGQNADISSLIQSFDATQSGKHPQNGLSFPTPVEKEYANASTTEELTQKESPKKKKPSYSTEKDMQTDYRLPIPDEMPEEILAEVAALTAKYSQTEPAPYVPTVSHSKKLKSSKEFRSFKAAFNNEVNDFKNKINEVIRKNAPLDTDKLLDDALNLIASGTGTYSVFDMLHYMRESDDVTYSHSLNVGLFCNVFAGWIHLSEEETRIATLAGLLCDIGKIQIPEQIIKKADRLSAEEFSIVKNHSLLGYMLLKDLDINPHVKHAALMHHERCDGSGYPFGLTGEKIDPYAKLVAIADVYDAMTSPRAFRRAISPFHAIETIQAEGLQKYDTRFIMTFLENVMNSFIGNTVHLSNGKQGEVVFIHKDALTRPIIKCGSEFIDLKEQKSIQVLEII